MISTHVDESCLCINETNIFKRTAAACGDVIVFFIGGGCYSEFYNLQELLRDKATSGQTLRNVMYGCTELLTGGDMLKQLEDLGKPASAS